MEVVRLQLVLTDNDLNGLVREHLSADVPVDDLEIKITADGVRFKGVYEVFVPVSFEALWELGVDQGKATARLAAFRTMGMPATILKSLIVNLLADGAKKEKWLQVDGDTVRLDLDRLLSKHGLTAETRLSAIQCHAGRIVVKAGSEL